MLSFFKKTARIERDALDVNGIKLDETEYFCQLGDVLDDEAGVQMTARTKVAATTSMSKHAWLPLVRRSKQCHR